MACNPKMTQEDLVGRLASRGLLLSQAQVAKIENGQRQVSDFELLAVAHALRVSVQMLFE